MAKQLTVAAIEKLKPDPQRRLEIPDGRLPGLYLIIQPGGAKSWAVRYRYAGRSRKFTIGPYPAFDLGAARQEASQALQRAQRGGDPAREKRLERRRKTEAKDDFESVVRLFIERYSKQNNRTWGRVARAFGLVPSNDEPCAAWPAIKGGLVARWGDRRIGDIARIDIIDLLDAIVARGAPIMANRTLAHLRKLFNWALDSELVTASPCAGVKPRAPEQSRDRVLSDAELKALWRAAEAMQGQFGPIVQLLILTGQRREEVGGMRWSELDLGERLLTLPASRVKNKTKHTVPLSEAAIEIIRGFPPRRKGIDFVFSATGRSPVSGFSRAKERLDELAEVSDWRLHDIRRTVASGMARLKIALPVIEKVLNHRSGSFAGIVGVYQHHDFADEKRAALERWAAHVEYLTSGKRADKVVALHG
jgi:integrase